MSKAISNILQEREDGVLMFWCPACDVAHVVKPGGGRWTYNGNPDAPTFFPSILVTYPHWVPDASTPEGQAHLAAGKEQTQVTEICHSFVNDGEIKFLGDCTHAMAGQTVKIPDWAKA